MSLPNIFDLIKQQTQTPKPPPDDQPGADDIFSMFGIEPSAPFAKTQASDQPGQGQKPVKKLTPGEDRVAIADQKAQHLTDYRKNFQDQKGNDLRE
ncbi:MAG TPA: hypothetical protein VG820_04430, partial [Fimbriimonadaceae bacterium]|nr:hypothetical protein [Fimbriimonadaceae bacterium]